MVLRMRPGDTMCVGSSIDEVLTGLGESVVV
jgi:hypothetical protein